MVVVAIKAYMGTKRSETTGRATGTGGSRTTVLITDGRTHLRVEAKRVTQVSLMGYRVPRTRFIHQCTCFLSAM